MLSETEQAILAKMAELPEGHGLYMPGGWSSSCAYAAATLEASGYIECRWNNCYYLTRSGRRQVQIRPSLRLVGSSEAA